MTISDTYQSTQNTQKQYSVPVTLLQLVRKALGLMTVKPTKLLEVGSSSYSVLSQIVKSELDGGANLICIDNDSSAIDLGSRLNPETKFVALNALNIQEIDEVFDLILDSHMIHCLESISQVKNYLLRSNSVLSQNGIMIIETMIANNEFFVENKSWIVESFPGNFSIVERAGVGRRVVFEQLFLEDLVKECGFEISYLYFVNGNRFVFDGNRDNAVSSDPDAIQLVLKKKLNDILV